MMEYGGYRWRRIEPNGRWFWLEEYVMMTAEFVLACPSDRKVDYGTGVFSFGQPRGSRGLFSGSKRVTTFGAGSVHVRVADNGGPCLVGVMLKDYRVVPLAIGNEREVQPVWSKLMGMYADAHKAYDDWRENPRASIGQDVPKVLPDPPFTN